MNKFRLTGLYLLVTLMAALTACGGGDGDNALDLPSVSDYQLQLTLLAQNSDAEIDVVTNTDPGRLRITLLDPEDNPAADQTITLTASNARLEINTVQSDANGIVDISVFAGAGGPAESFINAEYKDPQGDLAQAVINFETLGDESDIISPVTDDEFEIGATIDGSFQVGTLDLGLPLGSVLAANSTTLITAELRNSLGELITIPTVVDFSSSCALSGDSELDAAVTSVNGSAEATYRATGCAGSDEITATVSTATSTLTASAFIEVSSAPASSLQFISATPENIAIKGAGGAARQDFSIVEFLVTDSSNNPVSAQEVELSLEGVGSFEDGSTTASSLSNEDGKVTITIFSGNVPGNISIEASFPESQTIVTTPGALTVSGGLPHQDGLTLSFTSLNPNAYNYANIENQINIRATDRYSNPVPDGTTITLMAEAGQIDSPCSTVNGSCSVSWYSPGGTGTGNSNDARAPLNPDELFDRNGRVAVLAYMVGEESFEDENSDGLFSYRMIIVEEVETTALEFSTNIPEAFLDQDENGVQSGIDGAFEPYIDRNGNQQYDAADEVFQGVNCDSTTGSETHCSELTNIFVTASFVMASDNLFFDVYEITTVDDEATWTLIDYSGGPPVLTDTESFLVVISDENDNSPPEGTKVEVTIEGASLAATYDHVILGSTEPHFFDITILANDGAIPGSSITVTINTDIDGKLASWPINLVYPPAP